MLYMGWPFLLFPKPALEMDLSLCSEMWILQSPGKAAEDFHLVLRIEGQGRNKLLPRGQ